MTHPTKTSSDRGKRLRRGRPDTLGSLFGPEPSQSGRNTRVRDYKGARILALGKLFELSEGTSARRSDTKAEG